MAITTGAACTSRSAPKPTPSPVAYGTIAQSYSVDDIGRIGVPTLTAPEKRQVTEIERKASPRARHRLRFAFADIPNSSFFVVYDDGGYPNGDPSGRLPPVLDAGPGYCYDPTWNEVVECLRNGASPP